MGQHSNRSFGGKQGRPGDNCPLPNINRITDLIHRTQKKKKKLYGSTDPQMDGHALPPLVLTMMDKDMLARYGSDQTGEGFFHRATDPGNGILNDNYVATLSKDNDGHL